MIRDHSHVCAKFRFDRFILLPFDGENPQILPFLDVVFCGVVIVGGNLRKLNTGAYYKPSRLSNGIKIVSVFQPFMAKLCAQTLTFTSVTDIKADEETKIQRFLATSAAGEIRAPPILAW